MSRWRLWWWLALLGGAAAMLVVLVWTGPAAPPASAVDAAASAPASPAASGANEATPGERSRQALPLGEDGEYVDDRFRQSPDFVEVGPLPWSDPRSAEADWRTLDAERLGRRARSALTEVIAVQEEACAAPPCYLFVTSEGEAMWGLFRWVDPATGEVQEMVTDLWQLEDAAAEPARYQALRRCQDRATSRWSRCVDDTETGSVAQYLGPLSINRFRYR